MCWCARVKGTSTFHLVWLQCLMKETRFAVGTEAVDLIFINHGILVKEQFSFSTALNCVAASIYTAI